jgi:hypothetical protein
MEPWRSARADGGGATEDFLGRRRERERVSGSGMHNFLFGSPQANSIVLGRFDHRFYRE